MGILKKIFMDRKEWWHLVPDQTIFARGGSTTGKVLNLAARHRDGRWIMVYLGGKASFAIHRNKLVTGTRAKAFWIDPRTGQAKFIGRLASEPVVSFSIPDGWEDALLVLETPND